MDITFFIVNETHFFGQYCSKALLHFEPQEGEILTGTANEIEIHAVGELAFHVSAQGASAPSLTTMRGERVGIWIVLFCWRALFLDYSPFCADDAPGPRIKNDLRAGMIRTR
jgi:hypothetical protein